MCFSRKQVASLLFNEFRFIYNNYLKRDALGALKKIQLEMKSQQVMLNEFRKDLNQVIEYKL